MKVAHCIFTNFGVGIFDDVWLLYRFGIFKNTVVPSILNQSEKDFEWHIFIDKMLPNIFKNEFASIFKCSPMVFIHEVESYSLISNSIEEVVSKFNDSCLITSRIDDDDCLHRDAFKYIRQTVLTAPPDSECLVISLLNGLEYLPSDDCSRPVSYESLALGLSMADYVHGAKRRSVTQYAHHKILETLKSHKVKSTFSPIRTDFPLYLYTKHPLSDSYFFGARARILKDDKRFCFSSSGLANSFGLADDNVFQLQKLLFDAPVGMPHKYLEKLGTIRQQIKQEISSVELGGSTEILDKLEAKKRRFERVATRPNPRRNGNSKIRVAILGSCVTRDMFEIEADHLSDFEVVFYAARSSVLSYLSLPNIDSKIRISDSGFEEKRAKYDLDKTHWDILENSRPDIIIVDLIDERIGLINHEGSIFSASGPIIKAFERAKVDVSINRPWSDGVRKRRLWSIKPFLERVRSISPNIIFHKAEWAESYLDVNGSVASFSGSPFEKLISLNNEILKECFELADNSGVAIEFIGGKESNCMYAGGDHRWVFCPYHYDKRYYKSLARQLSARVL